LLSFFDCNTFIGKSARPWPRSFHKKDELLSEMDRFGIDEAIVFHIAARDVHFTTGNELLMKEIDGEDRLHGSWVLPLHHAVEVPEPGETIKTMVESGVKAVRIYAPVYSSYMVEPWACGQLFEALQRHRVPVLLPNSEIGRFPDEKVVGFSAQNIYDLCRRYPELPFIVVKANYSSMRIIYPMLRDCPNLHLEISYWTAHRGLEFVCKNFGAGRMVFGTGMPMNNPGAALMMVRYEDISETDRQLIAGKNLTKMLRGVK